MQRYYRKKKKIYIITTSDRKPNVKHNLPECPMSP